MLLNPTFKYEECGYSNFLEATWSPIVLAALYATHDVLELLCDKFTESDIYIARREINLLWDHIKKDKPLTIYLGYEKITLTQVMISKASIRLLNHEVAFKNNLRKDNGATAKKHRKLNSDYLNMGVYTCATTHR